MPENVSPCRPGLRDVGVRRCLQYNAPVDVILTHEHTDFDALASLLAAARLHPEAVPILPRQMNRNLRDFLVLYGELLPFTEVHDVRRRRVNRALLVDAQGAPWLSGMGAHTKIQIIDHHPRAEDLDPTWEFYGDAVGATTTLLVEQMARAGMAPSPIEATLLLLGIYEDTGSLTYTGTTARDIRAAAWLVEHGANLDVVNEFLHHPLTRGQQALYHQLVASSEPHEFSGQAVVIACATAMDYVEEISTLAHKVGDLFEPHAVFLLVDLGDRIQMVARSSSAGIDVGAVAKGMGGGGHTRAAAALLRGQTLEEARRLLLELLQAHVQPTVTVARIMSHGVQTLSPDTTVAEAAERMLRLGHEGYPVVENGRVVGMLNRQEIDRALHHNLGHMPVKSYMRAGEITVTPEDSVEQLQAQIRESGWGQVPVVDARSGEILGIVTRTDLLDLWAAPMPPPRAPEIARSMEELLPAELLQLLRSVGSTASTMGCPLYVVGGFVRDLLLGQPTFDVDLVVEGDAIALAKLLTQERGGRVRSHRRFGTAKWIPEADQQAPVESLDFVTARIEFYEHPTALPTVERSSIRQDLHRRDFTINTLAIRLDETHWGELLDFYGGERDLRDGLVRVLHSLSFVEDPTRILRAARFEQRFGFRIEPQTARLIDDALGMLSRVSGERIRHELYLILAEDAPEHALARLDELGVLSAISSGLHWDTWLQSKFGALRQAAVVSRGEGLPPLPSLYLALLTCRLDDTALQHLLQRLRIVSDDRHLAEEVRQLRSLEEQLSAPGLAPSEIYRLLQPTSWAARLVFRVATDSWLVRQRLDQYETHWKATQTEVDGSYLRAMGVPGGPVYRSILDAVLSARLDGKVSTRQEEEALVASLLQSGIVQGGKGHGSQDGPVLSGNS
jgi:tRNA nucleotidyltransferase (CCA-adding enzyme)